MEPSPPPAVASRPLRLGLSVLVLVAAADRLFFGIPPGASVAAYGALLAGCLWANRPGLRWDAARAGWLVLTCAALFQSAVEFNPFNFAVLGILFSAAMVDGEAGAVGARRACLPLALAAAARALGGWRRFADLVSRSGLPSAMGALPGRRARSRVLRAALPAIAVALPLLLLLSSGNALLGADVRAAADALGRWARSVHVPSAGRLLFWAFFGTAALTFLFPRVDRRVAGLCLEKWPRLPACDDTGVALWRTLLVLAAMNALFLWANGLDAFFLWAHAALPAKVGYSAFVHQGTFSLIATTLLSAVVLVVAFQQDEAVSGRAAVKALALLCVAQNLFLLSSVALRLKLYVEAYELSILRVHVCTFLVVVAAGYALLAWRVLRGRSLNWLVFSNVVAVFLVFYAAQFVDVRGIVARYNTSRWLEGRASQLDMAYLRRMGPAALPQYVRIARGANGTMEAQLAERELRRARSAREARGEDWRSWQWREQAIENQVFSTGEGEDRLGG